MTDAGAGRLAFFVACALLLAVERMAYVYVWRVPRAFQGFCRRPMVVALGGAGPVEVLQGLFYAFKLIQGAVFLAWWIYFADAALLPARDSGWHLGLAGVLIAGGQALNLAVFRRLGRVGVFYGCRLGHEVPWRHDFPFSVLRHPQYVGAVMTIWGFFLAVRFPHDDWLLLPLLETVYYAIGARCER